MALEEVWREHLTKEKPSWAFLVLSHLFRWGVFLRHSFYDGKIFRSEKFDACVVSVGNIACGGTGKTPLVQKLARDLSIRGKVAILSRGYRGEAEHLRQPLQISCGKGPETSVVIAGDESYLHASTLPGVSVWAGKHRVESAKAAIKQGAQILLLDDGMQHRKIFRDVEIVVLDGRDLFARQHFLPAGRLRDLPRRLKKADLIVVNYAEHSYAQVQAKVRSQSGAPVVLVQMQPSEEVAKKLKGSKVAYFCALGRPERFETTIKALSVTIVNKLLMNDHALFDSARLKSFSEASQAAGAEFLLCSSKDFVKIDPLLTFSLPLVVLDAEMIIKAGQEHWDTLIKKISESIREPL